MKKNNMKKGITLIEIILAIVLIAIILGITIPKLMSNSDRAEIKSVITSDVKSIVEAALLWKKSSATALGSYIALDGQDLNSRLPSNMVVATGTASAAYEGTIYSSGLGTGNQEAGDERNTGAQYAVTWVITTTPDNGLTGNFSIAMDISRGIADLTWDGKTQQYARDVFNDTIAELTNGTGVIATAGTIITGINNNTQVTGYSATATGATVTCTSNGNVVCYDNIKFQ